MGWKRYRTRGVNWFARTRAVAGLAILAAVPVSLQATSINLIPLSNAPGHIGDGSADSVAALAAMNRAAATWGGLLHDPVIINIWIDFEVLGPGILGSASSSQVAADYNTEFRPQIASKFMANPGAIQNSLPTTAPSVVLPTGFTFTGDITMTYANARALGFTDSLLFACNGALPYNSSTNPCDGVIRFSRTTTWDFDSSNGIDGNAFDLEGVTLHEIGHALGFFSEVDTIDCMLDTQNRCGLTNPNGTPRTPGPGAVDMSVLDLYRFADCAVSGPGCPAPYPQTVSEFRNYARYMAQDGEAVFSVVDQRWNLSRGLFRGDGSQASHWKDTVPVIGVMDPNVAPGTKLVITDADLEAMRALGYTTQVPEPATWVLVSAAFVAVVVRRRPAHRA